MSDQLKEKLHANAAEIDRVRRVEEALKEERLDLMKAGREEGLSYQEIGDALGVTKAYVHQQVKAKSEEKPPPQVVGVSSIESATAFGHDG